MNPGPAGVVQLQQLFQRILNISVSIAFIVLTIMLITAGIKYLTSGGDPKSLAAAGQTITWALLGLLFLALAWLILVLIKAFTGVDVLQFCIGFPGATNALNGCAPA